MTKTKNITLRYTTDEYKQLCKEAKTAGYFYTRAGKKLVAVGNYVKAKSLTRSKIKVVI